MNSIYVAVFVMIAFLSIAFYFKTSHKEAHFHSGFQIYKDGKQLDFSDPKYMSLVPCNDDGHSVKAEGKVHLHDQVGDVAHIHAVGVNWSDLFKYIKLDLSSENEIRAFVNGTEVNGVESMKIAPYDVLVLVLGDDKNTDDHVKRAVTSEYVKKKESESGLCAG